MRVLRSESLRVAQSRSACLLLSLSLPLAHVSSRSHPLLSSPNSGGIPSLRRKYRTRPAGVAAARFFDTSRDWAVEYARATGRDYHQTQHFVEWYSQELEKMLIVTQPPPPTAADAYRDLKTGNGRGAYRALYLCICSLSAGHATAESILACEQAERRARGTKALVEDPTEPRCAVASDDASDAESDDEGDH